MWKFTLSLLAVYIEILQPLSAIRSCVEYVQILEVEYAVYNPESPETRHNRRSALSRLGKVFLKVKLKQGSIKGRFKASLLLILPLTTHLKACMYIHMYLKL